MGESRTLYVLSAIVSVGGKLIRRTRLHVQLLRQLNVPVYRGEYFQREAD